MSKLRFYLALWMSKIVAIIIRIIDESRGTNLPGAVALKIDPIFIKHVKGLNPEKTVFITGTNGKSSTTKLLDHILKETGHKVISNLGGANLTAGVAVPLLKNCSVTGKLSCDFMVMETDERYISRIREQLPAKYLAITNIQKDQVQRNGEPSFIRGKIRDVIKPDMTVFFNNDEPNNLSLKAAGPERAVRYGVAAHEKSFVKERDFFAVTMPCPVCHSSLSFHRHNMENIGSFSCSKCGFSNDATPEYYTSSASFEKEEFVLNGTTFAFRCNRNEFLYSYTLATSIALELGVPKEEVQKALASYNKKVGQWEDRKVGKHNVKYFRIKQENSETLQSAISTIGSDKNPKTVIMGLDEYIDFYPEYINGCYMFDSSFKPFLDSDTKQCICTSPALGHVGALRFIYEGFDPSDVIVLPDSKETTLDKALSEKSADNIYLIEELPFWKKTGVN